ncbi:MAG: RNA-binding transcriptional accessory protein [Gemmataceae bacterium]|nr:RNA-binding transcriptional accessory protein [Gemmataceae bacterium]
MDFSRIAQDLQIRKIQVEAVVHLLDEDNTVPFITRYRKERTGGLNEDVIRQIQSRVTLARQLAERKQTILRSIEGQGRLTDELRHAILAADTSKRLEDLYLPYKPKKRTLATIARERGLEPLAVAVWYRFPEAVNLEELLPSLVNAEKELHTVEDVRAGVQHILAEWVAETADVRAASRHVLWETGKLRSARSEKLPEGQGLEYKDYFQFTESARQIPPHRILALNRGEKENALKVSMEWNGDAVRALALRALAESLLRLPAQPPSPQTPPAPATAAPEAPPTESTAPPAEGAPAEAAPAEGAMAPPEPTPAPAAEPAAVPPPAVPAPPPGPVVEGEPLMPDAPYRTPHAAFLRQVIDDALARLLLPSLENEIRKELREEAEAHAVGIFARNLRSLLLQPPLHGRRVLAIDPGFRTGCKVAALDETGNLLEDVVVFPHTPHGKKGKGDRGDKGQPPAPQQQPAPTAEAPPAPAAEAPPAPAPEAALAQAPEAGAEPAPPADAPAADPSATAPAEAAPPAPEPTKEAPRLSRRDEAKGKVHDLIKKHNLNVIAIGNGTACRETEEFVSELIAERLPDLAYVIVNEAGASTYSTSYGREEFPNLDATLRSTVSIGRRLQDPLSELVKVDPQNIGVGLYQHDVNPRYLKESLEGVIESCVNQVGVDLNTASVPLLRHVSGLNQMVARDLVEFRKQNGPFRNREQLMQVPNIGPARYTQAAGFLKIVSADNPLDRTWIHPESYGVTQRILAELGYSLDVIEDRGRTDEFQQKLKSLVPTDLAARLEVGEPTVRDILDALARPGRDPREDLPPPIFRKGILKLEDLTPGMELKGTVLNVVDFGAFVDIGLKDSGLVHISQMANRYIKSPYDVVAVGDVVTVWVLAVDKERHRVSLTMIKPGTERRPPERKPAPPVQQQGGPPRGARRPPPQQRPQGHGAGAGQGRGPARGPGRTGGPPRPRPQPQAGEQGGAEGAPARSAQPPPPPPRKPRRSAPAPKLSQAALEGKAPLRTFAELSALLQAKQAPPPPRGVPTPEGQTGTEATPPPPPAPEEQPAETTPVPAQSGEQTPPG